MKIFELEDRTEELFYEWLRIKGYKEISREKQRSILETVWRIFKRAVSEKKMVIDFELLLDELAEKEPAFDYAWNNKLYLICGDTVYAFAYDEAVKDYEKGQLKDMDTYIDESSWSTLINDCPSWNEKIDEATVVMKGIKTIFAANFIEMFVSYPEKVYPAYHLFIEWDEAADALLENFVDVVMRIKEIK